uniref:Uncharacterized protein n=2 Tax=Anopheles atroparvus TaxID=41427 RepID=A0AAG5D1I1_ANOAO
MFSNEQRMALVRHIEHDHVKNMAFKIYATHFHRLLKIEYA